MGKGIAIPSPTFPWGCTPAGVRGREQDSRIAMVTADEGGVFVFEHKAAVREGFEGREAPNVVAFSGGATILKIFLRAVCAGRKKVLPQLKRCGILRKLD